MASEKVTHEREPARYEAWQGVAWNGTAWHDGQDGSPRSSKDRQSPNDAGQSIEPAEAMGWHGEACHGAVWHGVAWHDVAQPGIRGNRGILEAQKDRQ